MNTSNLEKVFLDSFSQNDSMSLTKLYLHFFGKMPSTHSEVIETGKEIDIDYLISHINEFLPNIQTSWFAYIKKEDVFAEDDEEKFQEIKQLHCITDDCIYTFNKDEIFICHTLTQEQILKRLKDLNLPFIDTDKEGESKVYVVRQSDGDLFTSLVKLNTPDIDIDLCYNDDFKEHYKKTIDFLKSDQSGLILYYGSVGSGKTNLLRHLISSVPGTYIILHNSLLPHLASPDFIDFVSSNKNATFILEDCEQLLIDRQTTQFDTGISTLLNMSDGLLSDVFKMKFICTFNVDLTTVDSALLRKGRCYCKYEFKPLVKEKVEKLAKKHNIVLPEVKDMTLAELFNVDQDINTEDKPEKIGF